MLLRAKKGDPQGLMPKVILQAYAALKGRSSTVIYAFVSFSAACEAVPFPKPIFEASSGV